MPAGRDKITEGVIALIEDGNSLRKAAQEMGISHSTFNRWCDEDDNLANQYARAREERGFVLAEQTLEIADNPDLDANDKRVRIDARKWFASKLNPKQLGDKMQHTGEGGGSIQVIINKNGNGKDNTSL